MAELVLQQRQFLVNLASTKGLHAAAKIIGVSRQAYAVMAAGLPAHKYMLAAVRARLEELGPGQPDVSGVSKDPPKVSENAPEANAREFEKKLTKSLRDRLPGDPRELDGCEDLRDVGHVVNTTLALQRSGPSDKYMVWCWGCGTMRHTSHVFQHEQRDPKLRRMYVRTKKGKDRE